MNKDNKKKIDFSTVAIVSAIAMIILIVITLTSLNVIFAYILLISIIVFVIGMIGMVIQNKEQKEKETLRVVENMNKFQEEYDQYANRIGIVKSETQASLIELCTYGFEVNIPQYLWISNNCLNVFPMAEYYKEYETSASHKPDITELKLRTIPITDILYFEEIGELRKYTKLSGGGSSLKGGLIGYVLAGDAGAIVGSRESIKTEVVSEDDRRIELIYKNQDGEIENLEFTHDGHKVLKQLIPSKDLRRISNIAISESKSMNPDKEQNNSKTTKDKLLQLNELKAEGLITEEEFSIQRQKILDSV